MNDSPTTSPGAGSAGNGGHESRNGALAEDGPAKGHASGGRPSEGAGDTGTGSAGGQAGGSNRLGMTSG